MDALLVAPAGENPSTSATAGSRTATRVMAHMDELSMLVKRIEPDGSLHLTQLGTMYPAGSAKNESTDREACVQHAMDQVDALGAAFELHRFRASFPHEADAISHRFFFIDLVRAIRHVGYEQSALGSTARRARGKR